MPQFVPAVFGRFCKPTEPAMTFIQLVLEVLGIPFTGG
jgi:hypothetical protein